MANMKEKTFQVMKLKNIKFLKEKCLKSMIIYMKMRWIVKTTKKFMSKIMLWPVLLYVAEVEKKEKKIDGCRRKLEVTEFDILLLSEYSIRSKIGKRFINEKVLKEFYVKVYEIDPYFYKHNKEKIRVDENEHKYIPFRFDVNFSKDNLAVEIDEKGHINRDLIFEKKI